MGVSVIPVKPQSKIAAIPWRRWQKERPPEPLVRRWFAKGEHNVGLMMGQVSGGLFCLDHDTMPGWAKWKQEHRDLETLTVATPRPGRHSFFRLPDKVLSSMSLGKLDVKCSGYVLAPGSLHPNGGRYRVVRDAPILTVGSLEDVVDLTAQYGVMPCPHSYTERPNPTRTAGRRSYGRGLVAGIRQAMPILNLVARYTRPIPSSPDGRWFVCRCPMPEHEDRHPSFWIDAHRDICSCYEPGCKAKQPGNGRPMDVINLYSRLDGVSNAVAIRALAGELALSEMSQ